MPKLLQTAIKQADWETIALYEPWLSKSLRDLYKQYMIARASLDGTRSIRSLDQIELATHNRMNALCAELQTSNYPLIWLDREDTPLPEFHCRMKIITGNGREVTGDWYPRNNEFIYQKIIALPFRIYQIQ